jgi:ParB-like chromosome segregation protein Spo0J
MEATGPYQLLPPLTADEYDALKADIQRHGIREPIEYDTDGNVLDGHHRLRIAEELGLTQFDTRFLPFKNEREKREHVLAVNLLRRHLTPKQKREIAAKLLKENAKRSDRDVARLVGIDHKTVADVRTQAESRGELPHVATRVDSKGRQQPAQKPKKRATAPEDTSQPNSPAPVMQPALVVQAAKPTNGAAPTVAPSPLPLEATREERAEATAFAKELSVVLERAMARRPDVFIQLASPKTRDQLLAQLHSFSRWAAAAAAV